MFPCVPHHQFAEQVSYFSYHLIPNRGLYCVTKLIFLLTLLTLILFLITQNYSSGTLFACVFPLLHSFTTLPSIFLISSSFFLYIHFSPFSLPVYVFSWREKGYFPLSTAQPCPRQKHLIPLTPGSSACEQRDIWMFLPREIFGRSLRRSWLRSERRRRGGRRRRRDKAASWRAGWPKRSRRPGGGLFHSETARLSRKEDLSANTALNYLGLLRPVQLQRTKC